MDGPWKWLMRANARGVLGGAAVGLVLVTAWWLWKEFAPAPAAAPAAAGRAGPAAGGDLGLRRFVEEQLALGVRYPQSNPFVNPNPPPPEFVAPPPAPPPEVPAPTPPPPPAPPPPAPPAPPPRETVRLEFRGLMQASDGRKLALIADSRTSRSAFYKIGESFLGFSLETVAMGEAAVRGPGGLVTLRMKEPVELDLPR